MKPVLWLLTIALVHGSSRTVTASDDLPQARGVIAAAADREAIRLAAAPNGSQSAADWTPVRWLAEGARVIVEVKGGRTVEGRVVRVEEDQLVVRTGRGGDVEAIARPDVDRISVRPSSHAVRNGALLGAAVAALIGYIPIAGCSSEEAACSALGGTLWLSMFGGIGAGAGAAIGAVVRASRRHDPELIYRAAAGAPPPNVDGGRRPPVKSMFASPDVGQ